ncbi:MAG: metallophosphoesterase [Kofleriaceae bacterium]
MRLAHCSDLHLLSHDGAGWLKLANKRWIGAANLMTNRSRHYHVLAFEQMIEDLNREKIDHVLCTGDVTNLALRQEFEFARAMFDKLALGPENVTVIPGNHDAYVAEGVGLFAEIFAPYHQTDAGFEFPESDDPDAKWPIVRIRGELAIIGLTTSRQTPWFTAYGRLGDTQLERLKTLLTDPRLANKTRLVAIHHPPAGKAAANKIRGLRDYKEFAAVLAEAGAELVVHGHEHRDMEEFIAGPQGPIPVRGIASGTYEHDKPHRTARYRVFEIERGRMTSDHVRVWRRSDSCFTAEPVTTQQSNYGT